MAERIGRYLLIHPLATGGMGQIYLAEHTGLSGFAKRVVLKRIKPQFAKEKKYVELFLNEARVGSFVNHPNIVHIFDVGHEADDLWLVMEHVDGVDMRRLTRRTFAAEHPLEPSTVAAVMIEVLNALEEAHQGGPHREEPIIHRDLSPENILVTQTGSVKVLDFGLAKWSPGQSSVSSLEGKQIIGKTRYMPPEQLKGEFVDARSDLFSLGIVLYEALTNTLPFGKGDAAQVLACIMSGPPAPPSELRPGLPTDLDKIIARAVMPSPAQRFQTATDMRSALVEFLQTQGKVQPLEELRELLSPDRTDVDPETLSTPFILDGTPTEVRLAIAKRCGKCGGDFSARLHTGLILDRCTSCGGIWLDSGEANRLLGEAIIQGSHQRVSWDNSAELDRVVGSCPQCRVGLKCYAVPKQNASFEVCHNCFGVWLDKHEIQLFESQDVITWFRTLLDSLRLVERARE